jgi:hypothetical protein
MKKLPVILSALLLFLLSCKKQDDSQLFVGKIQIQGKVTDDHTNEGVPNVTIVIDGISSLGFMGGIRKEVGRTTTNQNGDFSTTINKIKKPIRYDFSFFENYDFFIPGNKSNISEEMLIEEGMGLHFPAYKLSDFIIELKKVSETDIIDTIRVSWSSPGLYMGAVHDVTIEGDEPYLGYMWKGYEVNSTIITKSIANRETIISWALNRHGSLTYSHDTIICERHAENVFIIEY